MRIIRSSIVHTLLRFYTCKRQVQSAPGGRIAWVISPQQHFKSVYGKRSEKYSGPKSQVQKSTIRKILFLHSNDFLGWKEKRKIHVSSIFTVFPSVSHCPRLEVSLCLVTEAQSTQKQVEDNQVLDEAVDDCKTANSLAIVFLLLLVSYTHVSRLLHT